MGWRLGQQIPQLMVGTALDRELGPLHLKRRGQPRIAIDHREYRSAEIARGQGAHRVEPGLLALDPGQPQIEDHARPLAHAPSMTSTGTRTRFLPIRMRGYQPSRNR